MNNKHTLYIVVILVISSVILRFGTMHVPFWVDEFSTADQAKIILENNFNPFFQTENYFEAHNVTTHYLVALSFYFFGMNEFAARFPILIFGSLVPVLIYLLGKELQDKTVGIVAAIFAVFSYWQIAWSLQARGYEVQQFILLSLLLVYSKLFRDKYITLKQVFYLFALSVLGILTHSSFIIVLLILFFHFAFFNLNIFKKVLKMRSFFISVFLFISVLLLSGQIETAISYFLSQLYSPNNNISYYHSFLWREQTVVSLLAFFGILFVIFNKKIQKFGFAFIAIIGAYIFFFSFVFPPYVSRYLLPIYPLLLILAAVAITNISLSLNAIWYRQIAFVIAIVFVLNGNTFVFRPKAYYSVNKNMREIAVVDYDLVYEIILNKGELSEGKTAVIDTWPDRVKWYLGKNQDYFYTFRWIDCPGLVNGITKTTPYELNISGEKIIVSTGEPPFKLIGTLDDLVLAMKKYQKGFIWIDDTSLPEDVQNYVKQNFYEELMLEGYGPELLENPYSVWPGTLYSWGFETANPYFVE